MTDFEKLGAFYLGKIFDLKKGSMKEDLLLYDSKDMTTHALCVGMTGSGKTGLCMSILEEAAIDGIPAIVIDPKGDMGNMLLSFPDLKPKDFLPWIDKGEAARKGFSVEEYAAKTASLWKKGLSQWDQDGSRIQKFLNSAQTRIYTPGSSAGLQVTALRSFDAPSKAIIEDQDALRDRILGSASGLLTLLGINADPIKSKEHILLSNILNTAWSQGKSLDIASLIREIQNPSFIKVGVFDLESFYPGKERLEFAMRLNNLLASPGFASWMQGEALNINRFLYTPEGHPKISIFSIAHLSESERMFFVTLLLNEVVTWMRSQEGTSSLRAILYMDEIYGYFPPTAVPSSKRPMLTLLKQARAYGLGVVLATQNPVDLDYKGLSNTGTWLIGRLQTERDKERVLDGLEGVSKTSGANFDRKTLGKILSSLGKRVFLMHNVHEREPVVFHTRWVLSYLRGPITLAQIKILMKKAKEKHALKKETSPSPQTGLSSSSTKKELHDNSKPMIPSNIQEFYLNIEKPNSGDNTLYYRPALKGRSRMHFVDTKINLDIWKEITFLAPIPDIKKEVAWDESRTYEDIDNKLTKESSSEANYASLPSPVFHKGSFSSWKKQLAEYIYQEQYFQLWYCTDLEQTSRPGETAGDFRSRLKHSYRENRDLQMSKLQKKYSPKLQSLEERLRKAQTKISKEESQYSSQKLQTVISIGATVLGALFGRKIGSRSNVGRATTSMRGVGRAAREKGDIARAKKEAAIIKQKLDALEEEFKEQMDNLQNEYIPEDVKLEELHITPRKSDISISPIALIWTPYWTDTDGLSDPAFL